MLKVTATQVIATSLKPGDLFSTAGPDYWRGVGHRGNGINQPLGEKVYIRTEAEPDPRINAEEETVYRITIETEAESC